MKPIYDQAMRAEIRDRMSPPNRGSVAEIARSTGITTQTLYNWRRQWQNEGQLVPATSCRLSSGAHRTSWPQKEKALSEAATLL
ncbi:helix-turn-helix domain-containing protein [Synechococcus sp. BSF8S]|uniref:transposase n=1 Tax=Synechococcales TaxID=1890424 RepID=UPI00162868D8|nr:MULTISPECIES: transposase [unclassified Synechococcus]MBC1260797.1 helix-turn-helix domain-containing protein [Synechococcus sp. BSF8S]MBC1263473.1 helix-turn-helix domain-containing protein [Synechococcus sp. BSA11S]